MSNNSRCNLTPVQMLPESLRQNFHRQTSVVYHFKKESQKNKTAACFTSWAPNVKQFSYSIESSAFEAIKKPQIGENYQF